MTHQISAHTETLLCWQSKNAGLVVLEQAIKALREKRIFIERVIYLVQAGEKKPIPDRVEKAGVEVIEVALDDPTVHADIFTQMRTLVLPIVRDIKDLHINMSPGTPAMHSVWLVMHAAGSFPDSTKLWATQVSRESEQSRIDVVDFPITTYLSEIRSLAKNQPGLAIYEPQAYSRARRSSFECLARYAKVIGAPLLILGERGTGKTRLVETLVAKLKGDKQVEALACGGLDSSLAESLLFGHVKGAFTGAASSRKGLLKEADGGILFLDEVQDLPKAVQRKLVRVFQDRKRRFRVVGSDSETSVDVELVCASNLPVPELRERLDADFFDRINHLSITVPPLRECREDIEEDWSRVWTELRQSEDLPLNAPWSSELENALMQHTLPGNHRDLQRLALLCMAWWPSSDESTSIKRALTEWERFSHSRENEKFISGQGTRNERIHSFRAELANWAKGRYGTWKTASEALQCNEKTLREDARLRKL